VEELLAARGPAEVTAVSTAGEITALPPGLPFDCAVLNLPLADDPGTASALRLAETAAVLVLAAEERCAALREALRPQGVAVLQKPLGRQALLAALDVLEGLGTRLALLRQKNNKLEQKQREVQLINRAKLVLISALGMTEAQAHRHMERQAMDRRVPKIEVAIDVLRLYEDR
jgi:response regulator NasT